ncbi:carboxypeptidase D-like [Coccinella septempunctata]|uniref:carboxypeptidase D-like n=1 Tax=Coccinella septempunctata TaxID=41139 RepID=UPI001D081BE9|nr:carboxypeptidase D-like [Coccinella septempunctata]
MHALSSLSIVLVLLLICVYFYPSDALEFRYHSNEELEQVMRNFSESTRNIHPNLYTIGKSSNGNDLWVMELSGFRKDLPDLPNIKFVANIHGNEAVGRELLLHFMEYLRDNYEKDPYVKCLLDNTRIHLLPSMNPDGFAVASQGRCNGELGRNNGIDGRKEDLNRNFPDFYHVNMNPRQPESDAVMRWMDRVPFTLSAGLHGGAMVANYPFDTERKTMSSPKRLPSLTPDNDVFEYLASTYAQNHPTMKNGLCEDGRNPRLFENGITNGASWYSFAGGMQDYNYFKKGCMEVTLEISCCKYPRPEELKKLWEQNKQSLLKYSLRALEGISGQIIDNTTGLPIKNASLEIIGRNMTFFSTSYGYFWRILLPGRYKLRVNAPGYSTRIIEFEVNNQTTEFCPRKKKFRIKINVTQSSTPAPKLELNDRSNSEQNVSKTREPKSISAQTSYNEDIVPKSEEILQTLPKSTNPLVSLSQNKSKLDDEREGEEFIRFLLQDPLLDVSKLKVENVKKFLRNRLQISKEDIKDSFDKILENFNNMSNSEKVRTFVKIFSVLVEKPLEQTDSKWLEEYLRGRYVVNDLTKLEYSIQKYDKATVFEKIDILLDFDSILAVSNAGFQVSYSYFISYTTLLMLMFHQNDRIPLFFRWYELISLLLRSEMYIMVFQRFSFLLFLISNIADSGECKYHSNDEIFSFMRNFSRETSLRTRVFSIGYSVAGIPLKVLEFNQPGDRIGVPNIKFIANIHGNEVVGREILIHFIKFLDHHYETDQDVKCLLDNARVYILPTMNPDGFNVATKGCMVGKGRHNKNDYDLNRNFPDYFNGNYYGVSEEEYRKKIQPETAAIMNWMKHETFVLSASLHGGAMVANYPFDSIGSTDDQNNKGEALTPDHDVVYSIAKAYVDAHERISKGIQCPQDILGVSYFEDGLTNGAHWYILKGGMQDYNYAFEGCIEITLEVSCCKYPEPEKIPLFLEENMQPLLQYGLQALRGIKGRVIDCQTREPIEGATLHIVGRKIPFKTSRKGEFWRILKPGEYSLHVSADGYVSVEIPISVEEYANDECPRIPMKIIPLQAEN